MENFKFHAYTEMLFGKGQITQLPEVLARYGKNVLMVYGGGSIKKSGIYDTVHELLNDFTITELSGVEPNPHHTTVQRGADLCKKNKIDVILAVGGGSVIDCSKVVAAAANYKGEAWDLVIHPERIDKVLPIVTILTLAATGSEMNKGAVITNTDSQLKLGTGNWNMIPKTSILDPTYLYTLPAIQTAAGAADIMSHVIEGYFKKTDDAFVQDRFAEGILQTVLKYTPIALENPTDYSARANLMWASSMALNGLLGAGKEGAWSCHPIEHELSAYYDVTHGIGLAILTPRWMRYALNETTVDKFCDYARNVWHMEDNANKFELANEAIDATENFFREIGIPMSLKEIGIDDSKFEVMAEKAVRYGGLASSYVPMDKLAVLKILNACR